ncbi:MAG: hypothetical protein LBN74_02290 [Prevotella sp.]|jgi:hypothetical protein|nr:hypothetical protein [Prevotella sp.]
MAKKKYISLTGIQYTFPVIIKVKEKDKVVWVSLKGNENDYVTANEDVQKAIEATDKFKNKEIGISEKQLADENKNDKKTKIDFDPAEFESVTDINGVIEVLNGEPYKVAKNKLKTPDSIKSAMETYNVSFPNLTF